MSRNSILEFNRLAGSQLYVHRSLLLDNSCACVRGGDVPAVPVGACGVTSTTQLLTVTPADEDRYNCVSITLRAHTHTHTHLLREAHTVNSQHSEVLCCTAAC